MNIKKVINKNPKILNLSKIFGDYAIQPFFLLVHLTLDCNCHCDFCYQKDNNFYLSKRGTIKPENFEKILKDVKKSFFLKPFIHFFGGEPLLNPHFSEILEISDDYDFKSSVTTNGILLDKYIKSINNSRLNQINISIDDIGARHDQARRVPGAFNKIIANIKEMRQRELFLKNRRKIININCLMGEKNYHHLFDLASYFRDNGVDIETLSFQHQYLNLSNFKQKIILDILKSQIMEIRNAKFNFKVYFLPNIKLNDMEKFYSKEPQYLKNNCNIPWLGLNILPNLEVTPGGGVLGCNQIVGDLRKERLSDIWNNDLMKKFRRNIINNGLPRVCDRCCHRQFY
jgi:MoaA/NifB/PqqE/SkfB family radical SAM enzyme